MAKLSFRTQYDRQRIFSSAGDPERIDYELYFDDSGMEQLREVGRTDLYAEIQSHKMSVDLNYLLSRYAQGDPDALSRRQGVYGDFSTMPRSYAELLNRVNEAQLAFDRLPVDTKHAFGDSMSQWLASYGSPAWIEKMGFKSEPAPPAPEKKEVISDES